MAMSGEHQIGRSNTRRVVCVDMYDEMCKTFILSLVWHINIVCIGDGFDLIWQCSTLCLRWMRNLKLDCDINFRLSRLGWYCVNIYLLYCDVCFGQWIRDRFEFLRSYAESESIPWKDGLSKILVSQPSILDASRSLRSFLMLFDVCY